MWHSINKPDNLSCLSIKYYCHFAYVYTTHSSAFYLFYLYIYCNAANKNLDKNFKFYKMHPTEMRQADTKTYVVHM